MLLKYSITIPAQIVTNIEENKAWHGDEEFVGPGSLADGWHNADSEGWEAAKGDQEAHEHGETVGPDVEHHG